MISSDRRSKLKIKFRLVHLLLLTRGTDAISIEHLIGSNPDQEEQTDVDLNESTTKEAIVAPLSCSCSEHLDLIEVDVKLPISAQKLFDKMFGTEASKFWDLYHAKVNNNSKFAF